jgi:hypothetical protein
VPEDPTPAVPLDEETLARERAMFEQIANIHQDPGCLSACLNSIPIQPWPHQIKILKRAAAEFPRSFLIADEVGLGKTIETGLILRYLLVSQKGEASAGAGPGQCATPVARRTAGKVQPPLLELHPGRVQRPLRQNPPAQRVIPGIPRT